MNHTLIEKIRTRGDEFYLIRVSIGPVQEFITEARKTRDLHTGSRLLSLATQESMKPIREFIIYPYLGGSNARPESIPNLYMAIIPQEGLESTLKQMELALSKFLNEIGNKVFNKLPGCDSCDTQWKNQIKDHFYMNWAAIPITIDELANSYKSKVKDIQHFFDERKMTRTFDQWSGSNAEKCVQCGHRESMPKTLFSKLQQDKKFKFQIKENERLCAICLLKRFYDVHDIKFESVSDISVRPFKQLIEGSETEEEITPFLNAINDLRKSLDGTIVNKIEDLGGEWFYREHLDHTFIEKQYGLKSITGTELKKLAGSAQEELKNIYTIYDTKPCKYYMILNMDGDDMGKLMSGDSLGDKDFTIDYQMNLSKILAKSGEKLSNLIKNEGNGYTVYSGGDDLLAFLPIKTGLPIINKLRDSFSEEFKNINKTQTSSSGIVILHHHDLLRRGLIESRKNVDVAKEWFKKKDAFVITLKVFSGTTVTWGSKWTIDNVTVQTENGDVNIDQVQVPDVLKCFVSCMTKDSKNRLSPDFIHDLLLELPAFYKFIEYKNEWVFNDKMFKTEFKRLLERHIHKASNLRTEKYKGINLMEVLRELFSYMADPAKNKEMNNKNSVKDNFEHFLKISSFLAREQMWRSLK